MSARRCGHVQRQDVRIGQELVEARVGEAEPGGCRLVLLDIVSNHIHAEAAGDFDYTAPDATGTDDTDHPVAQLEGTQPGLREPPAACPLRGLDTVAGE